jgi:hypothetical protein
MNMKSYFAKVTTKSGANQLQSRGVSLKSTFRVNRLGLIQGHCESRLLMSAVGPKADIFGPSINSQVC